MQNLIGGIFNRDYFTKEISCLLSWLLKSHKPEEAENNYGDMIILNPAHIYVLDKAAPRNCSAASRTTCLVRGATLFSAFWLTVFIRRSAGP